jgi:hypothetical protein
MQGKTTIQLFDAKTKKEVQRVTDKNLITNAYKKYIEDYLNSYPLGLQKNPRGWLNATPLDMARGIVLFDSPLPENPNVIYPTTQECIGHAGGDYAGADIYRGDYNSAESGDITNGYRQVWDFASDKANGTISSVGLTSRRGGDYGYKSQGVFSGLYTDTGEAGLTDESMYLSSIPLFRVDSKKPRVMGFTSNLLNTFVQVGSRTSDNPVKVIKFSTKKSGLGFKQMASMFTTNSSNQPQHTEYSFILGQNEYVSFFVFNNIVYGLWYNTSTTALTLKTYNLEMVEQSSLDLGTGRTPNYSRFEVSPTCGIIGDFLYVKRNEHNSLYKFNLSTGEYVEAIAHPSLGSYPFVNNFSTTLLRLVDHSDANYYTYYLYNGNEFYGPYYGRIYNQYYKYAAYAQLLSDNSPIMAIYGRNQSDTLYGALSCFAPCLFSINNLATPVVKDDTKTMKVTYDITW